MYNIGTAVIKSILTKMPEKEFVKEFILIRERYLNTRENSVEHFKYARLYNWCLFHYREKFLTKENALLFKAHQRASI